MTRKLCKFPDHGQPGDGIFPTAQPPSRLRPFQDIKSGDGTILASAAASWWGMLSPVRSGRSASGSGSPPSVGSLPARRATGGRRSPVGCRREAGSGPSDWRSSRTRAGGRQRGARTRPRCCGDTTACHTRTADGPPPSTPSSAASPDDHHGHTLLRTTPRSQRLRARLTGLLGAGAYQPHIDGTAFQSFPFAIASRTAGTISLAQRPRETTSCAPPLAEKSTKPVAPCSSTASVSSSTHWPTEPPIQRPV